MAQSKTQLIYGPHNKMKFVLYTVDDESRFISICISLGTLDSVSDYQIDPKHDHGR
jgi:hypothetical protein